MKLFDVIHQLDEKTQNKALKYFESPYFSIDQIYLSLLRILVEVSQSKKIVVKENVWACIKQNQPYNDKAFRVIATKTLTHLIDFFAIEELRNSQSSILKYATEFVQNQNINNLNNRLTKGVENFLSADDIHSSKDLYNMFYSSRKLLEVKGNFERKKRLTQEPKFKEKLYKIDSLLDSLYFIEKIRIYLILNNLSFITQEQLNDLNNVLIKQLKTQDFLNENKLAKAYEQTYDLISEKSDNIIDHEELLGILKRVAINQPVEAFEIYDTLYNYYVRLGNQGSNVLNELFSLLQFGLKSGILVNNEILDPTDYRNIVLVACRIEEYQWALDFIEKYKNNLEFDYRQSAYSFNKARVFMNMKRYSDVIEVLRNVEYEDITYNINSRLMLIASFYELDEYDILESTIKAFKVFLRRKRNISVSRKANFTDHCDVIFNLIKASDRKDIKRIEKAQEILWSNSGIPNKTWLKEKIAEVSDVLGYNPEKATQEDPSS